MINQNRRKSFVSEVYDVKVLNIFPKYLRVLVEVLKHISRIFIAAQTTVDINDLESSSRE